MRGKSRKELYRQRARRKNLLRRIFFLFLLVLIIFLILSKIGLFNVNSIKVDGNKNVETNEIINRSGLKTGQNIFDIKKSQRIKAINSIAGIKSSDIKFFPMRSTKIEVVERKPVFQIENYTNYYIIDEDLRIIDILNKPMQNLKDLTGVKLENYELGDYLYIKNKNKKEFLIKLIKDDELFSEISDVIFSKEGLKLETKDGIMVELGDGSNPDYKIKMLKEILKDIKATKKDADKIDMTKGDNPILILENIYDPAEIDQNDQELENNMEDDV